MKVSVFSLSTDGNNDQNLEKMNPVALCIFDINQHKVVTKFLDMFLRKSMTKYEILWSNCIAFGVDNNL